MGRKNLLACCPDCQLHDDNNTLTWDYVKGAIKGENDPLHIPVAYPAISFDKSTTKTFYQVAGMISGAIILGFVISSMMHEKQLK
jgi:hypothetical protein